MAFSGEQSPFGQVDRSVQIRNQRGELRAKLTLDLVGQRRLRRLPARGTDDPMTAILRNVRLDRRQLGDLMPLRLADVVARLRRGLTMPTRLRYEVDDCVQTFGGTSGRECPGCPG